MTNSNMGSIYKPNREKQKKKTQSDKKNPKKYKKDGRHDAIRSENELIFTDTCRGCQKTNKKSKRKEEVKTHQQKPTAFFIYH